MKIINTLLKQVKNILLVSSIALFSLSSYAGNTLVSAIIDDNDCNGEFPFAVSGNVNGNSTPFGKCIIEVGGYELAFVLTKFEGNGSYDESGDNYTYDANHWDIDINANGYEGSWSTSVGVGYPEVSFWSAKAADNFQLFWYVTDADYGTECNPNLTLSCMSAAISVTTGTWSTPDNQALSHLTFFGGICTENCEPEPPTEVPEPATIAIFALALGLLRFQSKRLNG